jgi:hypothetical protein
MPLKIFTCLALLHFAPAFGFAATAVVAGRIQRVRESEIRAASFLLIRSSRVNQHQAEREL